MHVAGCCYGKSGVIDGLVDERSPSGNGVHSPQAEPQIEGHSCQALSKAFGGCSKLLKYIR